MPRVCVEQIASTKKRHRRMGKTHRTCNTMAQVLHVELGSIGALAEDLDELAFLVTPKSGHCGEWRPY